MLWYSDSTSIQALENKAKNRDALLLHLCCDPNMRNVLQLTAGFIRQYSPHLLSDLVAILRACLILQCDQQACQVNQCTQPLLQLPWEIGEMNLVEGLVGELTANQRARIQAIWEQINNAFNDKAPDLQEAGWFVNHANQGR